MVNSSLDLILIDVCNVARSPILRRTADAYFKEVTPFLLHFGMFVPTIMGQGTQEQQAQWLPRALDVQILGTYAQVNKIYYYYQLNIHSGKV